MLLRVIALVVIVTVDVTAQERFEVASVKPSNTSGRGWGFTPSGFSADTDLYWVISTAFEIPVGLAGIKMIYPHSLESLIRSRFEIEARGEGNKAAMLRALLVERFGLKARWETRQIPLVALQVKAPEKLRPSKVNCNALRAAGAFKTPAGPPKECMPGSWAGTVEELILHRSMLSIVRRPLVNQTRLMGNYAWNLRVVMEPGLSDEDQFNVFRQALESQLGLTLKQFTGPYDVLVIDALHEPTPN